MSTMNRLLTALIGTLLFALAFGAPAAQAEFGLSTFEVTFTDEAGDPETLSGAHPHQTTNEFILNVTEHPELGFLPDEPPKNVVIGQVPGFAGNTTVVPKCEAADFIAGGASAAPCPIDSIVGSAETILGDPSSSDATSPVYFLEPGPGQAAKLGFWVLSVPVVIGLSVNPEPPYNIVAAARNISQVLPVTGSEVTIWGVPASDAHDGGTGSGGRGGEATVPEQAFLTVPRACEGQVSSTFRITSWLNPDTVVSGSDPTASFDGCAGLGFDPDAAGAPTTNRASSPSGFDFGIEIDDPGLVDPEARADSDLKEAIVTLPEGMRVNPAAAGGLGRCTEAQLDRETADSGFGEGCPRDSRVASVDIETPLLDEQLRGSIFLAEPFDNPLGELLVGYLVIKQPARGIILKIAGEISLDPDTGQVTASFDQNPQLPFNDLEVSFFEGARASLSTPKVCGDYAATSELYPWSGGASVDESHAFTISQGAGGSDCPTSRAAVDFSPEMDAGTVRPIAGAHSKFVYRLTRPDGQEDITDLEITLPEGLTGKLAGIPYCPESALQKFEGKVNTEPGTAQDEIDDPSCPEASRVGRAVIGAGTGPEPFYLDTAKAYLGGPYKGAPLSLAVIAAVKAGPFDLGAVMVRNALHVDQQTAQITVESDPIPTMIEGIPTEIRDLRVVMDREDFTLNPTSCDPMQVTAEIGATGGKSATVGDRFQVGECRRLGFEPRFAMTNLGKGRRSTLRSFNPPMRFTVAPPPGQANIDWAAVTLPSSIILDQSHLDTICTRDQLAADECPEGSFVGFAKAQTPLLDDPVQGRVFLASSDNLLPDLVADLRGQVRVLLRGVVDSAGGGRMRNTFNVVPDVAVSRFDLTILGGQNRGILVNSTDLCKSRERGVANFLAHNGRQHAFRPPIRTRFRGCKQVLRQEARQKQLRKAKIVRAFRAGRISRAQAKRMLQRMQSARLSQAEARRAVRR